MGRKKLYQNRKALIISLDEEVKLEIEQRARAENFPSTNQFILFCVTEHLAKTNTENALSAEVKLEQAKQEQLKAELKVSEDNLKTLEARVEGIRTLNTRTEGLYAKDYNNALKQIVEAPKEYLRMKAEGNAAWLSQKYAKIITPEELIAAAFKNKNAEAMYR